MDKICDNWKGNGSDKDALIDIISFINMELDSLVPTCSVEHLTMFCEGKNSTEKLNLGIVSLSAVVFCLNMHVIFDLSL